MKPHLSISSHYLFKFSNEFNFSRFLLQIFTLPIFEQETFFLEMVQRQGARGFGSGNVTALARSIEEEQVAISKKNHQLLNLNWIINLLSVDWRTPYSVRIIHSISLVLLDDFRYYYLLFLNYHLVWRIEEDRK